MNIGTLQNFAFPQATLGQAMHSSLGTEHSINSGGFGVPLMTRQLNKEDATLHNAVSNNQGASIGQWMVGVLGVMSEAISQLTSLLVGGSTSGNESATPMCQSQNNIQGNQSDIQTLFDQFTAIPRYLLQGVDGFMSGLAGGATSLLRGVSASGLGLLKLVGGVF